MKRVDWLHKKYADKVPVEDFIQADPTRGKRYADWLIRTYLDNGFRMEDLGKAKETLELFVKFQRRLEVDKRVINSHDSLSELWLSVKPFVETLQEETGLSGKETKRREKLKAYNESIILKDDYEGIVAIPLTMFASKWWGKGTRWCTAAEKDNYFCEYNRNGPLFVLIDADGNKTQLHVSEEVQYMDADDYRVDLFYINRNWTFLSPLILWALSKNGLSIEHIPSQYITKDMVRGAVRNNPHVLELLPRELMTPETCEIAVSQAGHLLMYVDERWKTEELCSLAVSRDPVAIAYTPKEFRTPELIMQAVTKSGNVIVFVLDDIPEEWKKEIFIASVKQDGKALRHVPSAYVTEDICYEAVKSSADALKHVDESMLTESLCVAAAQSHKLTLAIIPKHLRTPAVCKAAVDTFPSALGLVPQDDRDEEMCIKAVNQDGSVIVHVPQNVLSQSLCNIAANKSAAAAKFICEKISEYATEEIISIAAGHELETKIDVSQDAFEDTVEEILWSENTEFCDEIRSIYQGQLECKFKT